MKKKLFLVSASTLLVLGAASAGIILGTQKSVQPTQGLTEEEGYVLINSVSDFKTVFDGSATYYNRNIKLMTDINLVEESGNPKVYSQAMMAGNYQGILDGNGKSIYGFNTNGANGALFDNFSGTVKDLTIVSGVDGNIAHSIAFWGYGTLENVHTVYHVTSDKNTIGGYFRVAGNATNTAGPTLTNCSTNFVFDANLGNTFFTVASDYRIVDDTPLTTATNCYYTISGLKTNPSDVVAMNVQAGFTFQPNVSGIEVIEDVVMPTGKSENISLVTLGKTFTSASVSSSDNTVATATIDNGVVTINSLSAGDAVLTVEYVTTSGTVTRSFNVTVEGATVVTDIDFDKSSLDLVEGNDGTITATLKGNDYESLVWSSNDTSIATVSGNGLVGTVTAVSEGTTTVKLSITVAGSAEPVEETCTINVSAATKFDIYVLDLVSHNSGAMYLTYGATFNSSIQMSKVKGSNSADVKILYDDPSTDETVLSEYYVWKTNVNASKTGLTASSEIAFNMGAAGRYGLSGQLGNFDDGAQTYIVPRLPGHDGNYPKQDMLFSTSWSANDFTSALAFANTTVYSGTWRTAESICSYENMADVVAAYNALDADVKVIVNAFDDSTSQYALNTLGATIDMFASKLGSGARYISSSNSKTTNTYIIIIVSILGVSVVGIALLLLRKKDINN